MKYLVTTILCLMAVSAYAQHPTSLPWTPGPGGGTVQIIGGSPDFNVYQKVGTQWQLYLGPISAREFYVDNLTTPCLQVEHSVTGGGITDPNVGKKLTIAVSDEQPIIFNDVSRCNTWYWSTRWAYEEGITAGCGNGNYCPDNGVTRAEMAVFILRTVYGGTYSPPAATGTMFNDVAAGDFAAAWIEQLANEGITAGCGNNNYCPGATITRDQMAVFLLRALHGASHSPGSYIGFFVDVPQGYWADVWIEGAYLDNLSSGCGAAEPSGVLYCPTTEVTRGQMSQFMRLLSLALN